MPRNLSREDFLKLGGAGLAGAALLGAAGCGQRGSAGDGGGGGGGGDSEYQIKFSHVVTENTPKGQASKRFKKLVEEGSDGRISVQIYPNSELYGDEEELQALQSGSVQMLAPSSAKFTTIAPEVQVLNLPFIVDSVDEVPDVIGKDTQVGKAIYDNQALKDKKIKVMGLWDNGLRQLTSNREMREPSDLKGLEFRIEPSDIIRAQFRAWGARSTPMAFDEVYSALQQGVIDGQENSYSNIESQKMHTVQDYLTQSNHSYLSYVLVINNDWYEKLPDDLKKVLDDASDKATSYNREIAKDVSDEALQTIKDEGSTEIIKLEDSERQDFKDAVVPSVWNKARDIVGGDLVDELLQRQK